MEEPREGKEKQKMQRNAIYLSNNGSSSRRWGWKRRWIKEFKTINL